MNNVLLIVIDALASRIVQPAMEQGRLPNLRAIAEAGTLNWNCTAIFPSITPAATAALVTGGYPNDTGITGAHFYDTQEDRVHYYGDDIWVILREGFGNFFEDFLVRLNERQLRVETLYQSVENAGGQAACLNFLWFHGDHEHAVHVPWLMKLWPTVPLRESVRGPQVLALGDFVTTRAPSWRSKLRGPGGLWRRYGFNDAATSRMLLQLASQGPLPELTVAYFPNNDFSSHTVGPQAALREVERVDRTLGKLIALRGGLDRLLDEVRIVITGDHAQSDLPHDYEHTGIVLDGLLEDFHLTPPGSSWRPGDEILACVNMRAAQLYLRESLWPRRHDVIRRLLGEARIDQCMWWESEEGQPAHYFVATHDRGELEFWREHMSSPMGRDEYDNVWSWRGSLDVVDASVRDQTLTFGDYPNALERIVSAFDEQVSGDIWVTSRLGYEFQLKGTKLNRRGSHGSLHVLDSHSPIISAGANVPRWTRTPRSVDVAPLCRKLLFGGVKQAAH